MKVYPLRNIPPELWTALKYQAADEETNLRALVLKAIHEYLEKRGRRVYDDIALIIKEQ